MEPMGSFFWENRVDSKWELWYRLRGYSQWEHVRADDDHRRQKPHEGRPQPQKP